jgi:hypothetical protein
MTDEKSADDFMVVTILLDFRAKPNPKYKDDDGAPPLDNVQESQYTLPAGEDAALYLEQVVKAIREKRLYGFMVQECADSHCSAKQWIGKTFDDVMTEGNLPPGVIGFSKKE